MSELHSHVQDYLALRRMLGYRLKNDEHLLTDFVGYLEHQAASRVTTELALAWATRPTGVQPIWWHRRLVLQPHLWRGAPGGVVAASGMGLVSSSPS